MDRAGPRHPDPPAGKLPQYIAEIRHLRRTLITFLCAYNGAFHVSAGNADNPRAVYDTDDCRRQADISEVEFTLFECSYYGWTRSEKPPFDLTPKPRPGVFPCHKDQRCMIEGREMPYPEFFQKPLSPAISYFGRRPTPGALSPDAAHL